MHIEKALRSDLPKVVSLQIQRAEEFEFFNLYPKMDLDLVVNNTIDRWQEAPVFLLKDKNLIVGFAGTALDSFYWSSEKFLTDYMVYILPKYRSIKAVGLLYKAMKDYAKSNNLPLHLTQIGVDKPKVRERLMRRLGFRQTGYIMTMDE